MRSRPMMRTNVLAWALSPLAPWVAACGASDSQVSLEGGSPSSGSSSGFTSSSGSSAPDSSSDSATGSPGAPSGPGVSIDSGGSSGSGVSGSSGGASDSMDASGSSGTSGGGDGASSCPAQTNLARAVNVTLPVKWPAQGQTTLAGSGTAHVWLLEAYPTIAGTVLTGSFQTCKLELPDVMLGGLVGLALGGSKVQIQIPTATWAQVPATAVTATQTGWDPPSTFRTNAPIDLVGLKLAMGSDPALPWPASPFGFPQGTTYPDDDGDQHPGITGTPLVGNGYVLPPTDSLGQHTADKVYIVSRNQFALSGAWTGNTCVDQSGLATAMLFDNHVVGCHVTGGSDCTTGSGSQSEFIDNNRTVYTAQAGSFVAKILASTAKCSDAIAALP
ncbi:MAG: hypothetical protein M3O46_16520 [Myxococcota bacterium]|nr:hypothetical protein [Myxococcota bacterium]